MTYVYNKLVGALRYTGQTAAPRPASWRDFNIRPISKEWRTARPGERQPAYKSAVANVAYIWRDPTPVDWYGPMPAYFGERRFQLVSSGLLLPAKAPLWACDGYTIWVEADEAAAAEPNPAAISAWHAIMHLPPILRPFWTDIVTDFAQRHLVSKGAVVAYGIHACESGDGGWIIEPHCHMIVTARHWRHDRRLGQRHLAWIANRAQQERMGAHWRDLMGYLAMTN